jgi:hypothetical protein
MERHYAGSVAYDNEHDEWEDAMFMAFSMEDLCKDMKAFMKRRKNAEVHFAAYIDGQGKENDITDKIKEMING